MYKTYLLICFLAFYSCVSNETDKAKKSSPPLSKKENSNNHFTSLKLVHTNGPVKHIIHEIYLAKKVNNNYAKVALGNRNESSFDAKGNITKKLFFNSSKKLQVSTTYNQDASGKITTINVLNAQGKVIKTITLNYANDGYLAKEVYKNEDGKIESFIEYKWSPNFDCIETIKTNANHVTILDTKYTLNDFGSPTLAQYNYNNSKPSIDCKTVYKPQDAFQNWTSAIETSSKGSIFIHERVIEYYSASHL
jgi:hypothetical protein